MALHAIKAGEGEVFVSAGVESVSSFVTGTADDLRNTKNPLYADAEARTAKLAEGGVDWTDPRAEGLLPDVYVAMGQTAENVTSHAGISREDQDRWGVRSHNRAEEAIKSGFFEREITPVTLADGTVVSTDDGPRPGTTYEAVSQLKPVFRPDGTVTAGNACPLNDGAARTGTFLSIAAEYTCNVRYWPSISLETMWEPFGATGSASNVCAATIGSS